MAGDAVISRLKTDVDPQRGELQSEESVLALPQPRDFHNRGHLAFGPRDGFLYIGSGGGGLWYEKTGQNPSSLLGKIQSIDVTGTQQP